MGLGTALASIVGGVVLHPKGGDVLDVVNAWNGRHPDRQFELTDHGGVKR